MPDFQYIAREATGRQVTGILTASNQQDALNSLAARNLFPVKVDLADQAKAQLKYSGRRVSARYLSIFYTQLADLLRSGVPLLRSLELLNKQSNNPALKQVLEEVRGEVADGTRLAVAMGQHPKVFSELAVSMIRAGEEGGFLEDVLKRIANFTDHQEELKNRVVGAMIYPVFLTTFGTIIVSFLLVYFVPKFEPIFARMSERGELPWATTTLLGFSAFMQSYWFILIFALGMSVVGVYKYAETTEGRLKFDQFRLNAYGLGGVVRSLAIARFCRILGTLLANGVPILQSLRIAKDAAGNKVISEAIGEAAESISSGKSIAEPFTICGQFPEEVVEMIAVGEEANNLEQVLIDIADNMERQTNRKLDMFVRMLEPVMLLLMAAVVVFVMLALLLPVFQSSGLL
ncbi:MAG: type II secretion system F family protein [Planctomycetes bacterium]|nr:type II secretion system F family protein [Planctomycetota bacterium]MCH9724880.1 type II secretion system F family protein [Planctomycetota bacterium]MCH9776839.1 type II secretion system F family protein [Planctomycetota bacterium]MCH9791153.1 type II secretion system F family protein [Planctomycetota bacterium]MDF1743683.1 type II secretion system F family protein [Gimesia sp.]